jgi:hypothetical protein
MVGIFSPSWFLRILSLAVVAFLLFAFLEAIRFTTFHSGIENQASTQA